MKIKRLDIVGFKSFVDKVSLDFQQGITGVVGPNGCGKSNIVDAIRWVMGEQNPRQLRGRAMEDVIFGGSESRKPLGMAEVSIIFDNSDKLSPPAYRDYTEIMVTRRLYRNGDSDYLINKTPCRLLDITELFMDTGVGARAYSIIEQGKVGMLVSSKPEERRVLIEEAAGVTKFKARKKTAVRKMDATRQNLVRLGDIISEVRRSLSSLKRQAQRAETYRKHRAELKRIELCLAGNRFRELQSDLQKVGAEEQAQARLLEQVEARLAEGELKIEEKQLALTTVEDELSESRNRVYQLSSEVQRVEGELVLSVRQQETLTTQGQQLLEEQQQIAERQVSLDTEEQQLKQAEAELLKELEQVDIRVREREADLAEKQQTELELARQLEDCRRRLMELLNESNRLQNRREEIARRLAAEEQREQKNRAEALVMQEQQQQQVAQRELLEERLQSLREEALELDSAQEVLQEQQRRLNGDLAEERERLDDLRQQLELQRSRLVSLQELEQNLDGYTEGVRLLFGKGQLPRRVVADMLRVPPEHELAVEMALGERLQAIPVRDDAQLNEALGLLRENGARATLLTDEIACPTSPVPGGTPLVDLVQCHGESAGAVRGLLAGTQLVEDLGPYRGQSLPAGTLLVTPHGDCLSWRGELVGGAPVATGAGLLSKKREIGELSQQVEKKKHLVDEKQARLLQLEQQLARGDDDSKTLGIERHRLELRLLELQKDLDRIIQEEQRLQERVELLSFEEGQLHEEKQQLLKEQHSIGQGAEQFSSQQTQLEAETQRLQQDLEQGRSNVEAIRELLTEQRVELASLRERRDGSRDTLTRVQQNRQELIARTALLKKRREAGEEERKRLQDADAQLQVELDLLLKRRDEQQQGEVSVRERFEEGRMQLDALRDQLREVRVQAEERRRDVARLQLRHRELKVDADHLRGTVEERYRVDLIEHQVPEATAEELERLQRQVKQLQQKIEALGEVNLMAIEEHREHEERYEFLTKQRDDLHQSLDDLQKAINKINRTTRRRFRETFDQVNEKFKQVFPRLFRGGQAELRLTDEDDLLQSGIDIIVQPPGKRLQNVNLLSGGEKALTAVALIFSLFLIKPTPFCVLDEVDAPLDDANIDRFAEMVKEMSVTSQFILITHSKRTMTSAETMYGVTMENPGISKIVSVRMSDYQSGEPEDLAINQS